MRDFLSVSYLAREGAPSRLARYSFYCTLLVILIASFYPFTGWRYTGAPLLAFLFYPLPYYFTIFDNAINLLAYIPFGYFLTRMLPKHWYDWLVAGLAGVLVSTLVEFIQQFLPSRVSSNLDILSNGAGAFLGAIFAQILTSRRGKRLWLVWRHAVLAPGSAAEWGFVWLMLWFVSQLDPTQPFLGVVVVPRGLPQPFESPISNPAFFLSLLEGGGMMLNLLGVAFFVSLLARYTAQVPRMIMWTLLIALLAKMSFAGMLLKPTQFFAWFNLNIAVGGSAGLLILFLLWRLNCRLRALLGMLALLAAQMISWAWPLTPQFSATLPLFRWHYGHLEHLSGLANIINDIWPFGAMGWLIWMAIRPSPEEGWIHDSQFSRY
ncbi:MAG: VanZ family protein [Rudaea sp.]|nr:VanZ family protein [Rudaea sp.]